jgi:toxin ParE1/3/4
MSGTHALRELARTDLEAIWVYTVEQWGVERADRHVQGLFECFAELAANPRLGRERDDVKAGDRGFPQGRHLVFQVIASAVIEVIGVVHQGADVDAQPGEPPKGDQGRF